MPYTPGPWYAMVRTRIFDGEPPEHSIYHLLEGKPGQYVLADEITSEANAHLIAAAPELLETLKWLMQRESYGNMKDCPSCAGSWLVGGHLPECKLVALIAKADPQP